MVSDPFSSAWYTFSSRSVTNFYILAIKKAVLVRLRLLSLKMSIAGDFPTPVRVFKNKNKRKKFYTKFR